MIHNEHIIWGVEKSRLPSGSTNYLLHDRHMKLSQRNVVQCVHLFTQQFWLEDWKNQWLAFTTSWPEGGPEKIRITIRHTDWWYNLLGENSPLALDPKRKGRARVGDSVLDEQPYESGSWGSRFANLKGLKKLELELETIEVKRAELDTIIERARSWRFPLGDGKMLIMDQETTEKSVWTGSKHVKGLNAANAPTGSQLRQGSTAGFLPFKSTPRSDTESEELGLEDTLDYYVVLLTWRAQSKFEHDNTLTVADTMPTSSNTIPATTNTEVAPPTTPAPRGTYNRLNAIPTYYG